jgi:DNA-binding NarL/FixJ family response regulator
MLVAERLSNRAIAAQLHVSVRTVENHIFKAMAKTGTADRNELASLLARHRRRGGDAGSGAAPFHA